MSDGLMRDDSSKLQFGRSKDDVGKTSLMEGQSRSVTVKKEKL